MPRAKRAVLFLQLPRLDNDVAGPRENVHLAGQYLAHALVRSGEHAFHRPCFLPAGAEDADDRQLLALIADARPAVIAATLYLWNIERTLHVLREVRRRFPEIRLAAGGPDAAWPHPFLFRRRVFDAVVVGEGESVFPLLLAHWRGAGPAPAFANVAWRRGRRYGRGVATPPAVDLAAALPSPAAGARQPGQSPLGYLETTRGCPMRCAYCRYHHLHAGVHGLGPRQVLARVERMAAAGLREFRFIDPTFNANPCFDEIVAGLGRLNRRGRLRFFAELQADRLRAGQADALARAGFAEIEAGVQSVSPAVLRAIRRPARLAALEAGIRAMLGAGIKVTVDIMYGLPLQNRADVYASLRWAERLKGARVQVMQTLLLPGTDLRRDARRWGLRAGAQPPYGVESTPWLSADDIADIEHHIYASAHLPADVQTRRFVGRRLPDLFPERAAVGLTGSTGWPGDRRAPPPGSQNRRALVFVGDGLFGRRATIAAAIGRAVAAEPHALWQFVLAPRHEEPLDLLEHLSATLKGLPTHLNDRWAGARLDGRLAARRLFVRLPAGRRLDPAWCAAAEDFLRAAFY